MSKNNGVTINFDNLSEDLFLELFSNSIVSINIDKISRLDKVLSMCHNLNQLDLSETNSINAKDIAKLLAYPNITSLNLSGQTLSVHCIDEIKKLTSLKSLDISKCVVDNLNVINDLREMTNLSKLNANNVSLLSDKKG